MATTPSLWGQGVFIDATSQVVVVLLNSLGRARIQGFFQEIQNHFRDSKVTTGLGRLGHTPLFFD